MSGIPVLCKHCQRPPAEHIALPRQTVGRYVAIPIGTVLLSCPTAIYEPACPMCLAYPCRCAEVFSAPGSFPIDAPRSLAQRTACTSTTTP